MKSLLYACISGLFIINACSTPDDHVQETMKLTGPYLGQPLPDSVPELFAPGIVGTGLFTRDFAISPTGDEIYFCISIGNFTHAAITTIKKDKKEWQVPGLVSFSAGQGMVDLEPAFSPDGNRLYFLSTRPDGDEPPGDQDIWYVERDGIGWSTPVNPGAPLNTDGGEFFPSVTRDGYLYFTHNDKGSGLSEIFRSRINGDRFSPPEKLPEQVNCGTNRFNVFVSPDHDFAIIPAMGMEDSFDQVDYYISFRNEYDHWSTPVNLGSAVNKDNTRGWSPYVSPDGRFFFFMSNRSKDIPPEEFDYTTLKNLHCNPGNGNPQIYWMKADFINELRKKANFIAPSHP